MAGRQGVDVVGDPLLDVSVGAGGQIVETLRVHVADDRGESGRPLARRPHRRQGLAEQALGDQAVVVVRPCVAGQRLVRDLGGAPAGERVVDRVAERLPLAEASSRRSGRVHEDVAQVAVPLGVHGDQPHAAEDVGLRDRRLGDRLARAGRPGDDPVDAVLHSERDTADPAAAGRTDRQLVADHPPPAGASAPQPGPDQPQRPDALLRGSLL